MRRDRYAHLVPLILALAALPALQGCPAVIGAGSAVAVSTLEDRRTSGTQLEDATIESRASSRISEQFDERAHVNVAAFNRTSASVDRSSERARARVRLLRTRLLRGGERTAPFGLAGGSLVPRPEPPAACR